MKSADRLTEEFRARGLKVTPQRQAIFRVLAGSTVHPTADTVHAEVSAEMPTISLRTVYQTLNDLAAMGELGSLDVGTGAMRFDPNLNPHHHLVCTECGRVEDVYAEAPSLDATEGFDLASAEIVFRGRCATCAGARPSTESERSTHHHPRKGTSAWLS